MEHRCISDARVKHVKEIARRASKHLKQDNMDNVSAGTPDTLSRIQSMLSSEYSLPMERLAPQQVLADLGIDSLTTIEFMFKLEDEFAIRLAEERGAVSTVSDIAVLVDTVLQRQPS